MGENGCAHPTSTNENLPVDLQNFALFLAYLASAIGVLMVAPQILRIVRHPHLGGVSPWTWALTAVGCSLWLTYGLRSHSLPQIPGNVLLISGAVAIVLLVDARWSRPLRALLLVIVTGLLVALSTALTPEQVGFLAFGLSLTGMWPQVFETVWLRRGRGPSALSMTSQVLKLVSQVLWVTFAVLTFDTPVIVSAVVAITANTIVALVEWTRRREAARTESPVTPRVPVPEPA